MNHLDDFAAAFLFIFRSHRLDRRPERPIGSLSLDEAYAVQDRVIAARVSADERVVGYKVGCTSRAIRAQFGLPEPIRGRVLEPHLYRGDTALNAGDFHRPAVEPEFVLMIGRDLTDEIGDEQELIGAIEHVSPGVEVHHYDWWFGEPTSQELIASNGIHACLIIGDERVSPRAVDWEMEGVAVFTNGELAASGVAAEVMGGPLHSLRWLVNHLVRRGEALRAGELVIPGSATPLIRVGPGDRVAARFTRAGAVEAAFR